MLHRPYSFACLVLVFFLLLRAPAFSQDREPDVLYVPTPHSVVEEMLRLAELKEGELLYDLGSGDGRIVIAAARDFGARAVGIDIDRELVDESRRNAEEAGVEEQVRFIYGDLFETDFSDADVVTLFLLTELNLRLRPRLLSELRPGTRVVSHLFGMREWRPDVELIVEGPERNHEVYLWIIPADVRGTWNVTLETDRYPGARLLLDQHFQEVWGFLEWNGEQYEISGGEVSGTQVSLSFVADGVPVTLTGTTDGETLEGEALYAASGAERRERWTARRLPAAAPGSTDANH